MCSLAFSLVASLIMGSSFGAGAVFADTASFRSHWFPDEFFSQAREPRDVCAVAGKLIRYKSDREDEWQTPEETWARRAGDCEDFAILIQHVCEQLGYSCKVYVFFESVIGGEGHAIVAGQLKDGRWWCADNGKYFEAESWEQVRRDIAAREGWTSGRIWYAALSRQQVGARISAASRRERGVAYRRVSRN